MRTAQNSRKFTVSSLLLLLAFILTNCAPVQTTHVTAQPDNLHHSNKIASAQSFATDNKTHGNKEMIDTTTSILNPNDMEIKSPIEPSPPSHHVPLSHNTMSKSHNGITVMIEMLSDANTIKSIFGKNLLDINILPVLISFTIQSPHSYWIDISQIYIITTTGERVINIRTSANAAHVKWTSVDKALGITTAESGNAVLGALGALAYFACSPLAIVMVPISEKSSKATNHFEEQVPTELTTEVTVPGKYSCKGFLYFPFKEIGHISDIKCIIVNLREARNESNVTSFQFCDF